MMVLGQARDGEGEVVDVHLGDNDVSPSSLEGKDKVQHENPELRGGKARASRDAPGGHNESGVDPIHSNGAGEPVSRKAKLEEGNGVPFELGGFNEDPMGDGLEGLDQVKESLRIVHPSQGG